MTHAQDVAECPECRARLDISYRYDRRGRVDHIAIERHCGASCSAQPFFFVGAARLYAPRSARMRAVEMDIEWSEGDA